MMMELFSKQSLPFYKFGDLIFMEKISEEHWVKFIQKKFKVYGKRINVLEAQKLVAHVDCHSYYVQQLAQITWLRTSKKCSMQIVDDSHNALIDQLSLVFQNLTDDLSRTQVNYLKALINNSKEIYDQREFN